MAHEVAESEEVMRFEFARGLHQLAHVRGALEALGKTEHHRFEAGQFKRALDDRGERGALAHLAERAECVLGVKRRVALDAEPREVFAKVFATIVKQLRHRMQASIRDALPVQMERDFEQALIGQAEQRRAERRRKFDRILRVVDRAQQRGQVLHFLAVVKAAAFDGVTRHAGSQEGVLIDRDVAERTQQ